MGKYDDIIHLSRPVSARHLPMSSVQRAAQFSPFAALTGYEAVIQETGRLTDAWNELTESRIGELNEKLCAVRERIREEPLVQVTCFREDARKAGGAYVRITGKVKKIDEYENAMVLADGSVIPLHSIHGLEWV